MRTYPNKLVEYDCGRWGTVKYHQWLHPLEGEKRFTEAMLDVWSAYITPGTMCVDIGAHTGDTSVAMGVVAGPGGQVYAFEPNPGAYEVLALNAKEHLGIIPVPCAVFAEPGFKELFYTDDGFCNGGIESRKEVELRQCKHAVPMLVPGVPLSYIVSDAPGFLKIDTEGYDLFILESLGTMLRFYRPVIMAECFPDLTDEERVRLLAAIPECYSTRLFGSSQVVDEEYALSHRQVFDFVCIPHDEEKGK